MASSQKFSTQASFKIVIGISCNVPLFLSKNKKKLLKNSFSNSPP